MAQKSISESNPYSLFIFGINSEATRVKYIARLKRFFDFIGLKGTLQEQSKRFVENGSRESQWVVGSLVNYLEMNRERVLRKEITGGTLRNYVKTIKLFCEMNEISVPWKRITRGLPKARRYADDRAPTLEEIRAIIEYPDRRIRPLVLVMASAGFRVGAWDYLKWKHIVPVVRNDSVIAAKVIIYAGEVEEYLTFITPEAFFELEKWMKYRQKSGEAVTGESWLMRNVWDTKKGCKRGVVSEPQKLRPVGVKRLMEAALWTQGLRKKLNAGRKRHEFQTD